ncbi:hypothetical protein AW812_RS13860 [Acinetobacter baumannii]|nr:hypothetical protein [Acinetobacter baumannii]HAW7016834.1 hypothetical protein [Acinetobacter baumannii]HAW7024917.1 hypothetical protein [Acinetobacter baumannii]HAW7034294.1 hypothetical protein [Acinetobacter baumannii]HAW7038359.1 hypothetical protein [Acinetobacter baumannii]
MQSQQFLISEATGQIANEGFISKAPAAVIEGEKVCCTVIES